MEVLAAGDGIPAAPHDGLPHCSLAEIECPRGPPSGASPFLQQQRSFDRQQDIACCCSLGALRASSGDQSARNIRTSAAAIERRLHG
jgi:hypothetical protein